MAEVVVVFILIVIVSDSGSGSGIGPAVWPHLGASLSTGRFPRSQLVSFQTKSHSIHV